MTITMDGSIDFIAYALSHHFFISLHETLSAVIIYSRPTQSIVILFTDSIVFPTANHHAIY